MEKKLKKILKKWKKEIERGNYDKAFKLEEEAQKVVEKVDKDYAVQFNTTKEAVVVGRKSRWEIIEVITLGKEGE